MGNLELNFLQHIETNGDLLEKEFETVFDCFDYICISPKEQKIAEQISFLIQNESENYHNIN